MSALLALLIGLAPAPDAPTYARDIKPLLSRHCLSCHGATKPRGGLRLDSLAAVLEGGENGPAIVPGQPDDSPLVLAVLGADPFERMPLKRKPLPDDEIGLLRRWVAALPEDVDPTEPEPALWSLQAPRRPAPPAVRDPSWVRNPIDRFILARLDAEGLTPSPEADRATLIRRLSLDLIGLPPSPEQIDAFLHDDRPDAFERLVDRLLASPQYGERWARPWLDIARYADSNGYSIDAPRSIWRYRDWVINALNHDLPFDQFATDQLAGDLEPNANLDTLIATGFHRNTPINQEGGIDLEQFRVESVIDRANTTASAFLGLTMGCAQCHDHKFDPISQKEYYQFFAFFNNSDEPELPVATPEQVARRDAIEAEIAAYLKKIRTEDTSLVEQELAWEAALDMEGRQKQSQEVRAAFDVLADQRNDDQKAVVFAAFIDQAPAMKDHRKAIGRLRSRAPKIVTTMIIRERTKPRVTHALIQGDFTRPGDPVTPGVPAVLPPIKPRKPDRPADRLDLAHWLFDPANPLPARVTMNRLWQAHFGRGLVETQDDFGTQGALPSHPELLDWLATEFIRNGWSLKAIHRLIVNSSTYRQCSKVRPDLDRSDPDNRLLGRQNRLRLDAELVRDAALTASGLLTSKVGGPGVFPPQPDGVMGLGQMRRPWKADTGPNRYRRGLYTFLWRATPHPLLVAFDAPDAARACTRRLQSNTPLQALTLLNDEAFFECAQSLADRIVNDGPSDDPGRIDYAFRLCLARRPSPSEHQRLAALQAEEGWTTLARVLMNLDEFMTRE